MKRSIKMSKSVTSKTHAFLFNLGLHPVGGAEKTDRMSIKASVMRKSVRLFKQNVGKGGTIDIGDFRIARSRDWRRGNGRCTMFTVYRKGTWQKFGWLTFTVVPHSQVAEVSLDNEF
jgi:hypothetical protein